MLADKVVVLKQLSVHWLLWTLCIYWDVQWTLCTTCEHSVNIGLLWTLFYTQWWVQPTCWTERKNKEEGQAHPSSFCEDEKVITVNVKAYTACTFAYSTRQDKVYSVQMWRCWSDKKDWATMRIIPQLCTAMKFITPAQYSKSNQVFCG